MASVLRQLPDGDLDHIHHMIRRDANTDLEIALEAEKLLGKKISTSDQGRINVIHRYRNSRAYLDWLGDWKAERNQMERRLAEQRNRFEFLKETLAEQDGSGIEKVSKSLQARALALAAEAPEGEFLQGLQGKGWVANALKLAQATVRDHYRQQLQDLKKQLQALSETGDDDAAKLDMQTVISKVDEVMGLT